MKKDRMQFTVELADFARDEEELRAVRIPVFIDEQEVPEELEWDGSDAACRHVLARDRNGRPVGTARLSADGKIGRMAVLSDWRSRGVGAAMLQALLDLARSIGLPGVRLNAQVEALGFYERFGFVAYGVQFEEAGIQHRAMQRSIKPFEAPPPPPLGEALPSEAHTLQTLEDWRMALLQILSDARYRLDILAPTLEPLLFAQPSVLEEFRRIGTAGRGAQIRLLTFEPAPIAKSGHALIPLGQRLPSTLLFRTPVDPVDLDYRGSFVLNDRGGYVAQPTTRSWRGFSDRHHAGRHRQLLDLFNEIWHRSRTTVEFRELHI